MANHAETAKYLPHGTSERNVYYLEVTLSAAAAANDTDTITYPDGVPPSAVPVSLVAIHVVAGPPAYQYLTPQTGANSYPVITSFDPVGGTLVVTQGSSAGMSAGDKLVIVAVDNS
jgi:hypothetical protein